jgi:DUF1680 family protein
MTARAAPATASAAAVVPTAAAVGARRPLGAAAATVTGGFWSERLTINGARTIPAGFEQLASVGTLQNFELAATSARTGYRALGVMFDGPFPFLDSDVYKWLEGAAWELRRRPDPGIQAMADEAITLVERAQRPDGYINTFVQVLKPDTAYRDLHWGHELYCIGHLIQASVAWYRALGDDRLLLVAERAAASVDRELGPGGRVAIDGHPEIEMALVELYRTTGDHHHLDVAAAFIDRRGRGLLGPGRFGPGYWQDHLPVAEAPSVVGHAVRQLYLDCGAVDVAVERRDDAMLNAVRRRWRDMVETRTYLTGALGSRHKDEAFGDPFELPPDRAYAETCAAIASVMLAWRLLLATGDPACADVIERTVYNAVLPALSLDGTSFFYVNPLQRRTNRAWAPAGDGHRQPWYACACCPPNLMRLIGSWPQLLATTDDGGGVRLHQYASAEIHAGDIRLAIETDYPWDGAVRVTILEAPETERELALRVPGWCASATARDAAGTDLGPPSDGAIRMTRRWRSGEVIELTLAMPVRATAADPRIDAVRGCVAIERGPLVYAIESADLPAGVELEDVRLDSDARFELEQGRATGDDAIAVTTLGHVRGGDAVIRAVPYHTWGNRGDGAMRVWIPLVG